MRNKFSPIWSLFALFIFFTSCKKDNGFGSSLLPGGSSIDLQYMEDTEIEAFSKYESPLRTDRMLFNYLGHLEDPVFGTTDAVASIQYGLPADVDLSKAPFTVVDANVFIFYDGYAGDTTQPVTFNVYELSQPFNELQTYNSSYQAPHSSSPLGTISNVLLKPNTNQPFRDTLSMKSFLKIPIDLAYGVRVKNLLETGLITNDTMFNARFPGLLVEADPSQQGKTMLQLDLTNLSSGLFLTLKDKDGKEFPYVLPFSSSNFVHTAFSHNYNGTPVSQGIADNTNSSELFIQSQAGVKTEVKFNNLTKYRGKLINKAVIEIYETRPPVNDSLRVLYVYPLLKGQSGENLALDDYSTSLFGPAKLDSIDAEGGGKLYRYQVNITNLLNQYALGKKDFSSIYLTNYPVFSTTPKFILGSGAVQVFHIEPSSLVFGNTNYIDPEKRMKFKVWYSSSN